MHTRTRPAATGSPDLARRLLALPEVESTASADQRIQRWAELLVAAAEIMCDPIQHKIHIHLTQAKTLKLMAL